MRPYILSLMAVLLLAGCQKAPVEPAAGPAQPPVRARVETLTSQDWLEDRQVSATIESTRRSVLSPQIVGTIRQMLVEPGTHVRAGQTLVTLTANQYALAEAQGQAAEREARAALPELESALSGARAQQKLAAVNAQRMRELFAKKSVTRQELDDAEARLEQAQSQLGMLDAKRQQAESRIAQAEQGVKSAQVFRGYTTVVAPFAGVIVEKHAEVGAVASPGVPLLTLEGEGGYRVVAAVAESQKREVRVGQDVKIDWQDGTEPSMAKISEVLPGIDPATRSLTVRVNVAPRPGLRSGSFVRLLWSQASTAALSVPKAAVRTQGQLQMVFVVEGGVARSRMVALGEEQGGRYRVVSGLAANDLVVASLSPAVVDGARIEVQP